MVSMYLPACIVALFNLPLSTRKFKQSSNSFGGLHIVKKFVFRSFLETGTSRASTYSSILIATAASSFRPTPPKIRNKSCSNNSR
jgi:hypothetical protein